MVNIASELQSVIRLLILQSSAWRVGETLYLTHAVPYLHGVCMMGWKVRAYGL